MLESEQIARMFTWMRVCTHNYILVEGWSTFRMTNFHSNPCTQTPLFSLQFDRLSSVGQIRINRLIYLKFTNYSPLCSLVKCFKVMINAFYSYKCNIYNIRDDDFCLVILKQIICVFIYKNRSDLVAYAQLV